MSHQSRILGAVKVLKSAAARFSAHQGTDLAAAMTYYAVLALFPGLLALVSLLKLSSLGRVLLPALTELITEAVPEQAVAELLVGAIEGFFSSSGAGIGLVIGIVTATWAASGYVGAFARAMNISHRVSETRKALSLKAQQFGLTVLLLVGVVICLVAVVISGDLAGWLGATDAAIGVWSIVKWPVVALLVITMIALLYHFTPNVRFARFRPLSIGAVVGFATAGVAAGGFGYYASNFGSYDATYGTLAGVIIGLWLIWLINLALVFGAHLDAELQPQG